MENLKNLMMYLRPERKLPYWQEVEARIQIDNSLRMGWEPKDILFITNFPFEYQGIKTLVLGNEHYCQVMPRSTNTVLLPYLAEQGILEDGCVYWLHDIDAFQQEPITVHELGMKKVDVAMTTYGWSPKWNLGSYFFRKAAVPMFTWVKQVVYDQELEDERAFRALVKANFNGIRKMFKTLNITYNFGMRNVEYNYSIADLPIKVVHFHPDRYKVLQRFMHGNNGLGRPLMTPGLIEVFKQHGVG